MRPCLHAAQTQAAHFDVRLWPVGNEPSWQPQQRATAVATGVLAALVRHGQLFACLRRLLQAGRQPAVDAAGDTQMAATAERSGSAASALDALVSTLTARAAAFSAGKNRAAPRDWLECQHGRLMAVPTRRGGSDVTS